MREEVYNREKMAEFIHKCQRKLCAYDTFGFEINGKQNYESKPPSMCDCKFGATAIGTASESGNGCPEMRCVHAILLNMTDKEFARILKRMANKSMKNYKKHRKEIEATMRAVMEVK